MGFEMLLVSCLLSAPTSTMQSSRSYQSLQITWSGNLLVNRRMGVSARVCVRSLRGKGRHSRKSCLFSFIFKDLMNIWTLRKDFRCFLSFHSNPVFPCISLLKHISTQTHGECRLQRKKLEHQNEHQKARTCHMAEGFEDRTFMWWQYFSGGNTGCSVYQHSLYAHSVPHTAHTSKEVKWIRIDSSWPVNHWKHHNL